MQILPAGPISGDLQLHLDLHVAQRSGSSLCSPRWGGGVGSALLCGAPCPGVSGALSVTQTAVCPAGGETRLPSTRCSRGASARRAG